MSAGAFTLSKYQADDGVIHPIRVQPETLLAVINGAVNAAPGGTVTVGATRARSRGSKRAIGLVARWVSFAWVGAAPTGYKAAGVGRIPVMTAAVYNGATEGSLGDYLGNTIIITGKGGQGGR